MDKSEIEVMKLDATTDKEVLKYMSDFLVLQGIAEKNFPEKVREREMALPTGLPLQPYGVAVPHADPEFAIQRQLLISPLKRPVVFAQMGDPDQQVKVSFVFMLAIPDPGDHLTFIRALFTCFQDEQFNQALANWDGKKSSLKQLMQRYMNG
ncbi:PTS sugar transporter subunit IIA [Lentibacillus salicampi]|uniref:PTS sugar transporter subunit IIA n=1 Tax=Lentibacillus salicampi TaxID=175306 RepID=A0A4Y9AHB7_9BACI|nr:PTS sugar transporter subunit IIA [Lentibacillus salicampi]TFJ94350.1 PTS sugar transporter subunit IIA [Lentibacillus salicampi]